MRATFPFVATLFCFLLFSVFVGRYLFQVEDSDRELYRELIERSSPEKRAQSRNSFVAKQHRIDTSKETWFSQGGERLHYKIVSDTSVFVYNDSDGKSPTMIETMEGVTCFMQEEKYYKLSDGREATRQKNGRLLIRNADPSLSQSWLVESREELEPMQKIRYLEAEKGTFFYATNSFVAEEVEIQNFICSGHFLLESIEGLTPLMKGVAQSAEFSFDGNHINFSATHLKATIYSSKELL